MTIQLKRAYEAPADGDGQRVLVERLWPRGVTREKAHLDLWLKEVAPSTELRKWYGHVPEKWPEFRKRYREELKGNPAVTELRKMARDGTLTLIYAAHDEERNGAVVLREVLEGRH